MNSLAAELLVLRKRPSTWILLGVWVLLGLLFAYLLILVGGLLLAAELILFSHGILAMIGLSGLIVGTVFVYGNDPVLGLYWKGKSEDSLRRDRQLIVDFLVQAAGGPGFYFGRDMRTSHTRLGITEGEWQIFMGHTRAMLAHLSVPEREGQEVLGFFESLKADVVQPHTGSV